MAGVHRETVRVRRWGLPYVIVGVIGYVLGVLGLLRTSRDNGICNSKTAAANCQQWSDAHTVSVVLVVAGVILTVIGVLRMVLKSRIVA